MVDNATATVNTDGACESARKDAAAIRDAFSHKGIEEAYNLLKEDRKNFAGKTPEEQDEYEKQMVGALSGNDGMKNILPDLSIAYLKDHENSYKDPDNSYNFDVRGVDNDSKRMFDKREMEDSYAGQSGKTLNKVDDIQVALLGNAADLLKKDDYNGKSVRGMSDLEGVLKDNKDNAAQESVFQTTRDFNKSIAERLVKDHKMFGILDESNGDQERNGEVSQKEVNTFLDHCEKNPDFKALFTKDELQLVQDLKKTFDDPNNHEDDNQVFVKHWNPWIGSRKNWITDESIKEAVGGDAAVKALQAKAAEEKTTVENKAKEDDKSQDKAQDKAQDKSQDKVEDKSKDKKDTEENKDGDKKDGDKKNIKDAEEQMIEDAVQKPGEGPYQVASRLLHGKHDAAAIMALTKVLKDQLMEDTGSKTYGEAITKLEVGHKFFSCETMDKVRDKIAASGNQTLMEMFGKSQAQVDKEAKDAEANKKAEEESKKQDYQFNYEIEYKD